MNCLELMVKEHGYIKRMLAVIRKYCYRVMRKEEVRYEDFFELIDFVRNYADKHHHGKEEALLFNRMEKELGPAAEKLVRHGMLVEHDLGRLHMQELEEAVKRVLGGDDEARLDVIANAVSYTHLLHRHIDKEDGIVYKFAERNFPKSTLETLDLECERFEREAESEELQKKYIDLLAKFEGKV